MSFDYTRLVTDRAQGDVDTLRALAQKPMSQWTEAETAAFRAAAMRGAYNYTDLNRVSACLEDLAGRFRRAGYALPGYERIQVAHSGGARLPEGYTEVEYIESSGTQYVDSGLVGSSKTRIDVDYSTTASIGAIIGADSSRGSNMCTIEVHFAAFGSSNYQHSSVPSGRHFVSLDQGSLYLDEALLTTMSGTFTTPVNLTIFALNRNGAIQEYGSIALYSLKIYDDDEMVRDYVPCVTASDEAGLYDLVSERFFGNAGTGAFTAGPVVPSDSDEDERDPYTWYVDDVPTADQMARYLQNVAAVRDEVAALASTPATPESMALLNYVTANHIEANLLTVDDTLTRMTQSYFYTAEIFAGEV